MANSNPISVHKTFIKSTARLKRTTRDILWIWIRKMEIQYINGNSIYSILNKFQSWENRDFRGIHKLWQIKKL